MPRPSNIKPSNSRTHLRPYGPTSMDLSGNDISSGGGSWQEGQTSVTYPSRGACDACRVMKIRCLGKENPPCARCKTLSHPCTFATPKRKRRPPGHSDRLKSLEDQISFLTSYITNSLNPNPQQAVRSPFQFLSNPFNRDGLPFPANPHQVQDQGFDPNGDGQMGGAIGIQPHHPVSVCGDTNTVPEDHSTNDADSSDDPLEAAARMAPLRSMISAAAAAQYPSLPSSFQLGDRSSTAPIDPLVPPARGAEPGSAINHPVNFGLCTEQEGRRLYNLFFRDSHDYMPVFDEVTDTWESLGARSPFALTAILLVAYSVTLAGRFPDRLYTALKQHCELLARQTIFLPASSLETIQAMILLASWGDADWAPSSLAISMGTDMALYNCLPYLTQKYRPTSRTITAGDQEKIVIAGARIWLTLSKMKLEMAFNHGRPIVFEDPHLVGCGREFLKHPLTNVNDSRLVSACECLLLRAPLHRPFRLLPVPREDSIDHVNHKLETINKQIDEWATYWLGYYTSMRSHAADRLSHHVTTSKLYCVLHVNAQILHGVKNRNDIENMPPRSRVLVSKVVDTAQKLVYDASHTSTENYAAANNYARAAISFAARCLIRFADLLPEALDLRQTTKDIENLAKLIENFPGYRYNRQLLEGIRRARRRNVLPPDSTLASPRPSYDPLSSKDNHFNGMSTNGVDSNPSLASDFSESMPDLSFNLNAPTTGGPMMLDSNLQGLDPTRSNMGFEYNSSEIDFGFLGDLFGSNASYDGQDWLDG